VVFPSSFFAVRPGEEVPDITDIEWEDDGS